LPKIITEIKPLLKKHGLGFTQVGTGTGTLFHSQMRKGSWLVDIANDEIRVVDNVASDTEATLSNAFSSDLSSAAPSIIANTDLNIKTISVGIESGLSDGEIDGIVFGNGKTYVFTKSGDGKDGFKSFIDPIIIDGTGTTIDVTIER